jgi:hypothetical protein
MERTALRFRIQDFFYPRFRSHGTIFFSVAEARASGTARHVIQNWVTHSHLLSLFPIRGMLPARTSSVSCPTIQLADSGPRSFDKIPAALISVYKTTNSTKHILDIGCTAIYARYICHLYLTVPTTAEIQDALSQNGNEGTGRILEAKRALT